MINKKRNVKNQFGVGLIEVLIAAIVVAVGILALASLQGGLIRGSGENKARAVAVKLAEAKLEELRNNVNKDNFDILLAPTDNNGHTDNPTPAGSHETFTRKWFISDLSSPGRKEVKVQVKWGNATSNETVNMVSQIVWAAPGKATDYATDGNGLSARAPSPNNNSSETPSETFEPGTGTALNDGSGLRTHTADGYLYLLDSTGKALIKFKGGIQLTIKGTVYHGVVGSGNNPSITLTPTADYPVTFSDLAYCVFPVPGTTANYICYFGGACTSGGSGCPQDYATQNYGAVLGGWYGKVGLIETSNANFQNKKVCFAEDIAGTGINTLASTAREYVTRRLDSNNNPVGSEGINQSFACQNFLVVDKKGSSFPCSSFANYTISTGNKLAIPSVSIQRVLTDGAVNAVLAENTSSCGNTTKYVVTGTITGTNASHVEVMVNNNACLTAASTGSWIYSCMIETTATNLVITAAGGQASPATTTCTSLSPTMTGPTLVTSGGSSGATTCTASGTTPPPDGDSVPVPTWSTTGTPKSLTWGAITGATTYKVYTCNNTNNNSLTSCTNFGSSIDNPQNSYSAVPAKKQTICVKVAAVVGDVEGSASSVSCIYRINNNNNEYSYTP